MKITDAVERGLLAPFLQDKSNADGAGSELKSG
jgi:hypothetical protein